MPTNPYQPPKGEGEPGRISWGVIGKWALGIAIAGVIGLFAAALAFMAALAAWDLDAE